MVDVVILLAVSAINLILAFIVVGRNYKSRANRLYGVMVMSVIFWSICNFLTNTITSYQASLQINRVAFAAGYLMALSVWFFSFNFPYAIKIKRYQKIAVWIISPLVVVLSLTPAFVETVAYNEQKFITDIKPGTLYYFYIASAVFLLGAAAVNFVSVYRSKTTTSVARRQLIYSAIGIASTFVWILATAAVIPLITGDWTISRYASLGTVFLVSFIAYAIIKHRLFDIRLIVVRSLGYVLSLATIALIAFGTLTSLSGLLDRNGVPQRIQIGLYVALTLVLAASYQPFKKLFDRLTNKLFYRDAYETQTLLNEFNEAIVSTIDLEQLLERSGVVIDKYIKPDASAFAIRSKEDDTVRLISVENPKLSKEAIEQIRGYVHKSEEKVFVTDALEDGDRDLKLLLQEANVGMLVRITTDPAVEGTGYIILGYKKSGNVYNSQDTAAMEIMANELAIAIQNALQFEEIQQFTVTLQETVEEKTRQLRKSNEKLKQMDETKDEFISMASHQLRTPLTSVKGYVSMVIEGDAGELNPMQKKLLDQAFTSSQRMVYLIADLLNVSRLRTGKFVIDAVPSNLADVVKGEVDQLLETASSRNLELTYKKPDDFPELLLDETKVRQVIMNFIDNAIYYTPSGGHIKVELKDTGTTVEYTVTDDGLGVPKSEQHHLFTKFYRAGNAKKARPDGTGLGLFMAKKVIVAQGGTLIFKSTEGKGSTFGFSFDKEKLKIPDHYVPAEPLNGIKSGPGANPKS